MKGNERGNKGVKKGVFADAVCGAAVGAANGLFGGGGGMIAVPLLKKNGLSEKRAHATAIAVILPVSLLSFLLYLFRSAFDFFVALPTAIGGFFGGMLGAKCLSALPENAVFYAFTFLQFCAGAWLLFFR